MLVHKAYWWRGLADWECRYLISCYIHIAGTLAQAFGVSVFGLGATAK